MSASNVAYWIDFFEVEYALVQDEDVQKRWWSPPDYAFTDRELDACVFGAKYLGLFVQAKKGLNTLAVCLRKTTFLKSPKYTPAHNPLKRFEEHLRRRLYRTVKNRSAIPEQDGSLVGTDFDTLQAHLIETAKRHYGGKFFPNRKYQVDHITPCAYATTAEELVKLQHYTNLQYLYPKHNREKSDFLDYEVNPRGAYRASNRARYRKNQKRQE